MKRFFCTITFLFSLGVILSAQNYEELAKSGTTAEIKKALSRDESISRKVFGENGENFLMLALKNNRELKVIKYCLAVEIDVTQEAKDGRTSVMYACRYSTDPDVVEKVVKAGTIFGIGTAKRLSKKDSSGKNSYDYAKENENPKIYEVINEIEKDPAVVAAEKEAKAKEKAEKEALKKAEKEAEKEAEKNNRNSEELKEEPLSEPEPVKEIKKEEAP
ncbi:MAG: hypothetical protein J5780_04810, partial [Treponema sp.]|nr:hypothetical protein [Treponema sp.]